MRNLINITETEFKTKLEDYLDQVIKNKKTFKIKTDNGVAIVLSENYYKFLLDIG